MSEFLKALNSIRAWWSFPEVACMFYREGRQALLERARARTDSEKLAVERQRMEIYFQRANHIVDLAQRLEKIKDPLLRERMKGVIRLDDRDGILADDPHSQGKVLQQISAPKMYDHINGPEAVQNS